MAAVANILCWNLQISNRIKSKGLQKLRWFCQMCQKQCRDENGFKCHLNSESHKRQMEIFGQNADRVIAGYSEEFEADFMELMRRSHPNNRVAAKNVYNEFIADKYHIHMNSTKWFTLTEFVKYLGKTGIPPTLVTANTLHFSGSLVTFLLLVHKPICFSCNQLCTSIIVGKWSLQGSAEWMKLPRDGSSAIYRQMSWRKLRKARGPKGIGQSGTRKSAGACAASLAPWLADVLISPHQLSVMFIVHFTYNYWSSIHALTALVIAKRN